MEPRAAALPAGTVTMVFTDIEGSTALLQSLGDRYPEVLADHNRLIREAFARHDAFERGSAGDGLYFVFASAREAVQAAVDAQLALAGHPWPEAAAVRDRMGIHTGEPRNATEGYVGLDVHRAARICSAGHGGQILVSQTTRDLVVEDLKAPLGMIDLGAHRLRSLDGPSQRIYQVTGPGLARDFPPPRTGDVPRNNIRLEVTSFVGRDREIEQATRMLDQSSLLTLTGPGGVGKTRIGLRLARTLLDRFEDGAWIVECGNLSDPSFLLPAVVSAIGLPDPAGASLLSTTIDQLKGKRLLLVLDDCDPVLTAAAELAEGIVRVCSTVRIVVTSREALGVSGRGDPADRVARDAGDRPVRQRGRARFDRRLPAVRRTRSGGPAGLRADRPERTLGRAALPAPRRDPAGDRACGGTRQGDARWSRSRHASTTGSDS